MFWYGAVDIAPEHLVIWVLLQNELGARVPPWFVFDDTDRYQKMADAMDSLLLEKLRRMRQAVHEALKESGWTSDMPHVGFEWEQRVKEGGGFFYFK
ncbi:Hypothetical protein A7982_08198 [Minicystis rosea]|nr:Hypothetical protein A7982_08198 [Minicystis rosea]